MKKIGIITIPDYNNYGNRLQNYAVRQFFLGMGFEVDTLELNDVDFPQYKIRKIKLLLKKYRLNFLVYAFELLNGSIQKVKRYKKFKAFTSKYLNVKYYPNGDMDSLKKVVDQYDYIVLGSDQIWHPTVNKTPNLFFATFVPDDKLLFFAPSFGLETLPAEYAQTVKEFLAGKQNISVRESAGQKLIKDLTGSESVVLPDPTLCVSTDEWKQMIKPIKCEPYVMSYFLGNISDDYKAEVKTVCDTLGVGIYNMASADSPEGFVTGPDDFVSRIANAEYVVTDSFHAVVFCIILKKDFTVFSRLKENGENAGLDSRIDLLLKKFSLQDRKFVSYNNDFTKKSFDAEKIDAILAQERKTAIDFFANIKGFTK